MAKPPTIEAIAANLTVPQRMLLFCLAWDTDWAKAGMTRTTIQHLLIRNLVARNYATQLVLTEHGRAVLAAPLPQS
jgi:hypothetical protein